MHHLLRPRSRRRLQLLAAILMTPALPLLAHPAWGAFHLNEINQILPAYDGDPTIQAVELKMLSGGENLVAGLSIKVYDASGVAVATLGTFASNLPAGQALAGRKILCATPNFAATFGITPDLVINPGVADTTGQVSFESATCVVNAVAYGAVTVIKNGTTSASPIPPIGATALVRTADDGTLAFCPLAEDAGSRFVLRSGIPSNPLVFTNNAGVSVNVSSAVTGVGTTLPAELPLRVYPNPSRGRMTVEAPGYGPLAVYDIQGRLVRVLTCIGTCPAVVGPFRGAWDGADGDGRRVPSGVYFLRYAAAGQTVERRVVLLR